MAIQKTLFSLFSNTPLKSDFSDIKDDNYLILQTPPEWFPLRDRKFWWCALYSLKAVIEWKNEKSRPIKDYSVDWRSRTTYLMTPRWITKVLKKYKLKYKIIKASKLSENEKLEILKNNLKKWPIILLVANGQTKRKRFSWRKAIFHRHYITLWWYNDKKKIFYVYDSNTKRKTQQYIMKWTLQIPYKYILKQRWIWASKLIHSYAIAVKY